METVVPAKQIQIGDIIQCICAQGCIKPESCVMHCNNNLCNPQIPLERVTLIRTQATARQTWIYFTLTNNKRWGTWADSAVTRVS